MPPNIYIACASTKSRLIFRHATWLGISLGKISSSTPIRLILRDSNSGLDAIGLSSFYNRFIENRIKKSSRENTILVFCHDDIYIHDWNIGYCLEMGLSNFDIIGPIGCQQAKINQPGWASTVDEGGRNKFLPFSEIRPSGSLNHFDFTSIKPDVFHPIGVPCALLDGCFLAVRLSTLEESGLRFDERFLFHCYDADFCRQASSHNLKLGSWPILLSHQSGGEFGPCWEDAAREFKRKWCENQF